MVRSLALVTVLLAGACPVGAAAENLLAEVRTGAGSLNSRGVFEHLKFTSGATGAQTIIIRGMNLNKASTMDATIAIEENQ